MNIFDMVIGIHAEGLFVGTFEEFQENFGYFTFNVDMINATVKNIDPEIPEPTIKYFDTLEDAYEWFNLIED